MRDPEVLAGVRVLDLGIWRPAPFAGQLLAELGASVTKIEPRGGDPMRAFPALYRSLNERKEIVELDLKDPDDRERALAIAVDVDVVVEGFRPGVADRLGVGPDAVAAANPGIVYCSITGFGQDGPLAPAPGHDLDYQAWAGVLAARSPEIHRSGIPIGDLAGGSYAALSICAALVARARTGQGCRLDVSMTDVLVSWAGPAVDGALVAADDPDQGFPAYGAFACRDGAIVLGIVSEQPFWVALCGALDLGDVEALDVHERMTRGPELRARIASAVTERDRDELVNVLLAAGVPAAPVLTADEAIRADHFVARGTTAIAPDGTVTLHHPVRYS